MDEDFRKSLFSKLQEIEKLQQRVIDTQNTPAEGETRSSINEIVAFKMGEFGADVAEVENWANEAHDYRGQLEEQKKIDWMKQTDPDTDKNYTATKAESLVSLDEEVKEALRQERALNHSVNVLTRKTKSMWAWLDNSRSRLSWIGKDRSNA